MESCGQSSSEDLKNILKELSHHYDGLLAKNMIDEAKEFRGKMHPTHTLYAHVCFTTQTRGGHWWKTGQELNRSSSKSQHMSPNSSQVSHALNMKR